VKQREVALKKLFVAERDPGLAANPAGDSVSFVGDIVSHVVIAKDDFALSLWRHDLAPEAEIWIERPQGDHVFYVLGGEARVGDVALPAQGVACFARSANGVLKAGAAGVSVLHYVGDAATRPDRAGGCVHVLPQGRTAQGPGESSHTLYLDSGCSNCAVWLHRSDFAAGYVVHPHFHTEDEVIAVVDGTLQFGTRTVEAGGGLGIGERAVYGFEAGERGLGFLNFRQADPSYGRKGYEPKSERQAFLDMFAGRPPV